MTTPPRRRRIAGERRRPAPAGESLVEPAVSTDDVETEPPVPETEAPDVVESGPDQDVAQEAAQRRFAGWPRGRSLVWFVPVAAIMVAALVLAGVAGTSYVRDRHEADAVAQSGSDATSSATTAAESILSYTYTSVDDDIKQSEELMTDDFAGKYDKIRPTVAKLAKQRKLKVTASVRAASLLECGEDCSTDEARVLMFVDQTRTSGGDPLSSAGLRTVFTMSKVDGHWLVSDFESQ